MLSKEVLIKARELIATPETWTQGQYKGKRNGKECYCLAGAIWYAANDKLGAYDNILFDEISENDVIRFNDSPFTRHKAVLAWLDEKIAAGK